LEGLGVNGKHINMDLQEIVWEDVVWIVPAQDRDKWRVVVKVEVRKSREAGTIHRWFTGIVLLG